MQMKLSHVYANHVNFNSIWNTVDFLIHLFIYLSQGAQSMIGKTFYQSIVINQENYLIGIDRYWSIDDQHMVTH